MPCGAESTSYHETAALEVPANVAHWLGEHARRRPDQVAVAEPDLRDREEWRSCSFRELNERSDRLAAGLCAMGVTPGTRLALLVRPGIDFVALVFALLKSGAVAVLIDPGMGRKHLVRCLAEVEPEGFIAVSAAHAARMVLRRRFPKARFHVTVGRRWFWGGLTLQQLERLGADESFDFEPRAEDSAAVIFTTGSTGPPKGVLYRHENFVHQVAELRGVYGLKPGGVDIAGFPLFGLFNAALGVTTVFPEMDFTRPAAVDPDKFIAAARHWQATQSFGSPALWNRVGTYCQKRGIRLDTLRQVFSAGAPVPGRVLATLRSVIHPEGEVHTPYGATEALPVATISASEVLRETQPQTDAGRGVCVGRPFPGIQWRIISISDDPIATLNDAEPLPPGKVGELIVAGPVVTREYVTRTEHNALAKIADGPRIWHRMGDVGRLDEADRFWFYGRKSHRVHTADETLFTIPCEAIYNVHPQVNRVALVGVGTPGSQRAVIVIEPISGQMPRGPTQRRAFIEEIRRLGASQPVTRSIGDFLLHPSLPVDIRHNAKIFREKLVPWAAAQLRATED